jgi:hypothetical protein
MRFGGLDSTVLSVGKLAAGQAGYYLALARRSVDHVASVTSGVEDYYLGGPEAAGECAGSAVPLASDRRTTSRARRKATDRGRYAGRNQGRRFRSDLSRDGRTGRERGRSSVQAVTPRRRCDAISRRCRPA